MFFSPASRFCRLALGVLVLALLPNMASAQTTYALPSFNTSNNLLTLPLLKLTNGGNGYCAAVSNVGVTLNNAVSAVGLAYTCAINVLPGGNGTPDCNTTGSYLASEQPYYDLASNQLSLPMLKVTAGSTAVLSTSAIVKLTVLPICTWQLINTAATALAIAPATITGIPGSQITLHVSGGTPPYYFKPSQASIISINNVQQDSAGATITATLSNTLGNTSLIVTDDVGAVLSVAVTNAAPLPGVFSPMSLLPAALSSSAGSTLSFLISGGSPAYQCLITDPRVIKSCTTPQSGISSITLGDTAGSAAVIITDANGNTQTLTVTNSAAPVAAAIPLTVTPTSLSGTAGNRLTFHISGGKPAYRCTITDPYVISSCATGADGTSAVTLGDTAGTAAVIITDANDSVQTLSVTNSAAPVAAAIPLTVTPASLSGSAGSNLAFHISGGQPSTYRCDISDSQVVSTCIVQQDGRANITLGSSPGNTSLIISDAKGGVQTLTVTNNSGPLTVTPATLSGSPGNSLTFRISGGKAGYLCKATDSRIVSSCSLQADGTWSILFGNTPGTATLIITDALANTQTLAVTNTAIPLTITPATLSGTAGNSLTFRISGGQPSTYRCDISDSRIINSCYIQLDGTTSISFGYVAGTATLIVSDGIGGIQSLVATNTVTPITFSPASVTMRPTQTTSIFISGGSPPYAVTSSNGNLLVIRDIYQSTGEVRFEARAAVGNSTLMVVDSAHTRANLTIVVAMP